MTGVRAVKTQRNQIPSTGRMPHFLARQYGFASAKRMAEALPEKAIIIDIGSGVSRLGHFVAKHRPDITWINADLAYANPELLTVASKGAPKNVEFVAGDVIAFSPELHTYKGKADRVFSYWLMPHLSLNTISLAENAAATMWELLKPEGQLVIGPIRSGWLRYKHSLQFSKRTPKAVVASSLARATELHWLPRKVQSVGNRYNVHVGNHILAFIHWWQQRKDK